MLYPNATFSLVWNFPSSATAPSALIIARAVLVGEYKTAVAAG